MALIQAFTYFHTNHCQRPSKTYIFVCEWENQLLLFWQQELYKVSARRARGRRVPVFIGRVRRLAPSSLKACPRSPAAPSTVFICLPGKHNFGAIALRNINRTLAAKQWRHMIEKQKQTQQESSVRVRNNNEVKKNWRRWIWKSITERIKLERKKPRKTFVGKPTGKTAFRRPRYSF